MWTINDFPAYGNLSGCVVKGYYACLICGEQTKSCRLPHSKKNVYTSHRTFLPLDHSFRYQKKAFNGQQELEKNPEPMSGEQILSEVEGVRVSRGKKIRSNKTLGMKRKKGDNYVDDNVSNDVGNETSKY